MGRLESDNFELNKKVEKVINSIEDQKRRHLKELGDKDDKIHKTLKEIQKQMEEYQNLLQVKTALDMEIAVYKQLLETEEDRLGIMPEQGLNDSYDLGSDEEGPALTRGGRMTYNLSVSTENMADTKRTIAQTQI